MSNHEQQRALISALYEANVINQEELKKAELYLSLLSLSFTDQQGAVDWMITNRIVSRDREDQVRAAFASSAPVTPVIASVEKPELTPIEQPESHYQPAATAQNQQPIEPVDLSAVQSRLTNQIYSRNLQQLQKLKADEEISLEQLQMAKEKLKGFFYLVEPDELADWVNSDFDEEELDFVNDVAPETAQQLFFLLNQGVISEEEYWESYYELALAIDVNRNKKLHFINENNLFDWLAANGCLSHQLTSITAAKKYHHNLRLVKELQQRGEVNIHFGALAYVLEDDETPYFNSAEQAKEWILFNDLLNNSVKETELAQKTSYYRSQPKPKRFPFFFCVIFFFVLYKIISGIFWNTTDEQPSSYTAESVTAVDPADSPYVEPPLSAEAAAEAETETDLIRPHIPNLCARYEPDTKKALEKVLSQDSNINFMGSFKGFEKLREIDDNTCQVVAIFADGTASIRFEVRRKRASLEVVKIQYSHILPDNSGAKY